MKYCKKCNVAVNSAHANCPLCGRFVGDTQANEDFFPAYQQMDSSIKNPEIIKVQSRNFLTKQSIFLFVTAIIACIIVNFLTSENFDIIWWPYVALGLFTVYISIFQTIVYKRRLYIQITLNSLFGCLLVVLIDFLSTGFKGEILRLGIPIILSAGIITTDFLIIFNHRKPNSGYYITLATICLWAIFPQLILWLFGLAGSMAVAGLFYGSIINFLVVLILNFKQMRTELSRRFFINN